MILVSKERTSVVTRLATVITCTQMYRPFYWNVRARARGSALPRHPLRSRSADEEVCIVLVYPTRRIVVGWAEISMAGSKEPSFLSALESWA
jgi:hypothetical protein